MGLVTGEKKKSPFEALSELSPDCRSLLHRQQHVRVFHCSTDRPL